MSLPKILLIYTGGTIGMEVDSRDGSLVPLPFDKLLSYVPELDKINCELDFYSFEFPVDSSDADQEFWNEIGQVVESNYEEKDGFVILHGTDTMAYTASALSFMLENLNKPIVLTGSQLPMGTFRTDGRENLISAIEIASKTDDFGKPILREVAVYFEYSLYRGNRSHKISTEHFDAIISPNYAPLAEAGVNINWNYPMLKKNEAKDKMILRTDWNRDVAVIKFFPGIPDRQLEYQFASPGCKAFILETYGAGNMPLNDFVFEQIEKVLLSGKTIINVSQCRKGRLDQGTYASGLELSKLGVLSAKDMTIESAIVKCMYLMGLGFSGDDFKRYYESDLRGELS